MFRENESLENFLTTHLSRIKEGDLVVITSKIVALSQGRVVPNLPSLKAEWIRKESARVIRTPWCWLTLRKGQWCANAGIDESNAGGKLILFPSDPFRVAWEVRRFLLRKYRVRKVAVLITDTRSIPLRVGVMGVAVGYAGFSGLKSYVGSPDLFGRKLHRTQSNRADGLAASAVTVMGEGSERTPLAIIRGAPLHYTQRRPRPRELFMRPQNDLYRPIFLPGRVSRRGTTVRRRSK